jgi:UDP-N-acetylmuramate dehydrogenase
VYAIDAALLQSASTRISRSDAADLVAAIKGRVLLHEPMSRHTTFGIGGPADLFVEARSTEDVRAALLWLRERGLPTKVIGNGSNLLVADRGLRGGVVKLAPPLGGIEFNSDGAIVGAGARLARLLQAAANLGWSGLESTVGIPGTVGGAIVMNAGTDTGTFGDLVTEVTFLDERGEVGVLRNSELKYSYRSSILPGTRLIVLQARVRLERADPAEIRAKMERLLAKRARRQPLRQRCAGSVFRNPELAPAGKLLDRAGGKGMHIGDAQVSLKHANFIINRGHATASDVRHLIEQLQELALRVHGIWLEPEIEFAGDW